MSDGFPLLTTKKMAVKTIQVELEGFIKGVTDKSWYKRRGCNIWNQWTNPHSVDDNDLGPMYGWQWRRFGSDYCMYEGVEPDIESYAIERHEGYDYQSDQLMQIADRLRTNPYDRRMVCSAWNPNQISQMALPPCIFAWNACAYGDTLNLSWTQRSCDTMLGLPFDIAHHAFLLCLLAKHAGLKPGNLTGLLVDCHIYMNHITEAKAQVKRIPTVLPTVRFEPNSLAMADCNYGFNIFKWDNSQTIIKDYNPQPKIKFGEITV